MSVDTARLRELLEKATPGPWRIDPASLEHDDPFDASPPCYGIAAGKQTWHRNRGLFHPSNAMYDENEIEVVEIGYDRDYSTPEAAIPEEADAALIVELRNQAPALLDRLEAAESALTFYKEQPRE